MKKFISVLLSALFVTSTALCTSAATETNAKLYNIYGDDMLF